MTSRPRILSSHNLPATSRRHCLAYDVEGPSVVAEVASGAHSTCLRGQRSPLATAARTRSAACWRPATPARRPGRAVRHARPLGAGSFGLAGVDAGGALGGALAVADLPADLGWRGWVGFDDSGHAVSSRVAVMSELISRRCRKDPEELLMRLS